mmetsp:Transcript_27486/g.50786  ORF Transcript_27486/g.50786 Transcript_27486/m.50786 type:complete len:213 (+) Transcript_27486:1699-2337(+)
MVTDGHAHLEDGAAQPGQLKRSSAARIAHRTKTDVQRLGQILNDLRCADKSHSGQDGNARAALAGPTIIHVRGHCEGRVRVGAICQFAKDGLASVPFVPTGNVFGVACNSFGIGLADHVAQRAFLENLLKANDIGIHCLNLLRQPVDFPRVFLRRVLLKAVIFLIGADQVFDVETGDAERGHSGVSNALANRSGSTLPPEIVTTTSVPSIWS